MAMVICGDQFLENNFVFPPSKFQSKSARPYLRRAKLYNLCSGKYVEIVSGSKVFARSNGESKNAFFILKEAKHNSKFNAFDSGVFSFTIFHESSQRYLCFNKKAKLITRVNLARNGRCVFQEQMDNEYYSEFKSLFNETYRIAFDRKGRSLPGTSKKCFRFLTDFDMDIHQNRGPKFNPNKAIHYLRGENSWKGRSLLSKWSSR